MLTIRPSRPEDRDALFGIWLAAVRATHDFLTEEDIAYYAGQVREAYLPQAEFLVAVDGADRPVGFMGMTGAKIDALFVDPSRHGQGVGRALVSQARSRVPVLEVDVNEQNGRARAFYERLGFRETSRSELDDSGRPFPLIHMALMEGTGG
ncbi:acetyltransferase [Azospirillum sp. SYSU D00513]|uniref:acetyltransferase n=1 Tax=Azospirillum sp. SYSU D00513 TaxID=2812561 RepID=UPI001A974680|nr:acetyltransferase [Azospirillum sp. SYSU D00513]